MKYALLVVLAAAACGGGETGEHKLDLARSSLTADRTEGLVANGDDASAITVRLVDDTGQPLVGATVELVVSGRDNALADLGLTNSDGEATTRLTTTAAERKDVTALVDAAELEDHVSIVFGAGAAHALAFRVPPTTTEAGAPIAPAVEVSLEDAFGNLVFDPGDVSLTLAPNPGSAVLAGTTTQTLVDGVAAFTDLTIATPATGYTLIASSTIPVAETTSTSFDIILGSPSASTSTLVAMPETAPADGSPAIVLTATIRSAGNIPLAGVPVSLGVTGDNNFIATAGGTTDALGQFTTKLGSSTAEPKMVTVEAGSITLTGTVTFTPAACVPQLPGPPVRAYDTPVRMMLSDDFDADGHPDLALVEDGAVAVVRNVGTAGQTPPVRLPAGQRAGWVTSGDVNNDGAVDLVVTSSNSQELRVYLGDGYGAFAAPLTTALTSRPLSVELALVDGDSVPDAIVRTERDILIFSGVGTGSFQPSTTYVLGIPSFSISSAGLVMADVDGNGRPDIITVDDSRFIVLLGNANGTFQTPVTLAGSTSGGALQVADFDEDSDLDVLVASGIMENDGTGWFTLRPVSGVSLGAPVVGDFNGDGHLDIAGGQSVWDDYEVDVLHGQGDGTFVAGPAFVVSGYGATVLTDVNDDARPDLVVARGFNGIDRLDVMLAAPGGDFVAASASSRTATVFPLVGDFDGDGAKDIVAYTQVSNEIMVLRNQGAGFVAGPGRQAASSGNTLVASGDFNEDGKLDVLSSGSVRVYPGTGDGGFLAPIETLSITGYRWVAGQLNGDSHLDLVGQGPNGGDIAIAFGVGDGRFVQGPTFTAPTSESFVVGDFDNDGDDDVAVGLSVETVLIDTLVLLRNNGDGTFTRSSMAGPVWVSDLAIADFDHDGNLDLVSAMLLGTNDVAVFMGHGDGTFAPYVKYATGAPAGSAVLTGDLDGDTYPDVVAMGSSISLLRGRGDGTLSPPLLYGGGASGGGGAVADFDGDGREDVIHPGRQRGLVLIRNQGCQ